AELDQLVKVRREKVDDAVLFAIAIERIDHRLGRSQPAQQALGQLVAQFLLTSRVKIAALAQADLAQKVLEQLLGKLAVGTLKTWIVANDLRHALVGQRQL